MYGGAIGIWLREIHPIIENEMDKKMEHEMDIEIIEWLMAFRVLFSFPNLFPLVFRDTFWDIQGLGRLGIRL